MKGIDIDMQKGSVSNAGQKAGFKRISKETLMLSTSWVDLDIMRK